MKKSLSLLLALLLVFSLGISALADTTPTYSITVNQPSSTSVSIDGNTYSAYKLFDVTYNGDAYAYTISSSDPFYNDTDLAVIDDYFTLTETSTSGVYNVAPNDDYDARAFADAIQACLTGKTADGTADAADGSAVIALEEAGYYIVAGSATAAGSNTVTAAIALTNADPTGEVAAKLDSPTLDKVILNADSSTGKGTAQDVGSVVNFQLDSKVPSMTGYSAYTFVVNDKMTSGLTFDKTSVEVTIGGEDYTGFTVSDVNNGAFTITFADFIAQADNAGDAIVITYSATLNANALNTDVETNTVSLTYSNNPYDNTKTNTTPEVTVNVYDFDIVIDKYTGEGDAAVKLANAKFVLKNADGKYYFWNETSNKVEWVENEEDATVVITDTTGAAFFKGLDAGTYYLHETEAPKGYNPLTEDVTVVVSATYNDNGTIASTSATSTSHGQYKQTESVQNNTGAVLPETGGIGTTLFYVFGGALVVAAAILLITKKRMSSEG